MSSVIVCLENRVPRTISMTKSNFPRVFFFNNDPKVILGSMTKSNFLFTISMTKSNFLFIVPRTILCAWIFLSDNPFVWITFKHPSICLELEDPDLLSGPTRLTQPGAALVEKHKRGWVGLLTHPTCPSCNPDLKLLNFLIL